MNTLSKSTLVTKQRKEEDRLMHRYYVEFDSSVKGGGVYLYVMAYSQEHVKEMFPDYNLVAIDQTD